MFPFVVLLVLALSVLVVKPFITALLAAAVFAYIFYPVHAWLSRRITYHWLSALLVSILIVLLLVLPAAFLIEQTTSEARFLYLRTRQKLATGDILGIDCPNGTSALCRSAAWGQEFVQDPTVKFYLQDAVGKLAQYAISKSTQLIFSLPGMIVSLLVAFFTTFYLLLDGAKLAVRLKRLLPVKRIHQEQIAKKLQEVLHAVMYGSILVAVVQGVLGGIGFLVFGVPNPILWGIVMALFALVPFIGTAIIWAPAGLLLVLLGYSTNDTSAIWRGIGLLLYGTLIVGTIDNILKPKIIGARAGVHPVLVLVGVLGGLALLGPIGFVIGPLILSLLEALLEIYEQERREA